MEPGASERLADCQPGLRTGSAPGGTSRRVLKCFLLTLLCLLLLAPLVLGQASAASAASANPAPAGNPGLFGLAGHAWWMDPDVYGSQLFPAIDDLKVTNVRLSIDWKRFEPTQGHFDWSLYDRTFGALASHHIIIIADFSTIPAWASTNPAGCGNEQTEVPDCQLRPDMMGAFENAMRAAITRYSWIQYWEFWNEPEIWHYFSGDIYLTYLKAFYDIAHSINPEIVVAADTLAGPTYIGWLWNISDARWGKGHQPWDAVAYHPYNLDKVTEADGQQMPIRFDLITQLHQLTIAQGAPNMRIWITEYGWSNTPQVQAANLTESLNWMETQPYIQFADLHMLFDWSPDPSQAFGLMRMLPDASGQLVLTPDSRFVPKQPYYDTFKDYPRNGLPAMPNLPDTLAFPQTGHTISGRFLSAWKRLGGLAILGYPLTRPYPLQQPDGSWLLVQDFERARLEYHPELSGTPYEVEASLIGVEATAGRQNQPPFQRIASCTPSANLVCFSQTGHSLSNGFLAFWKAHGGLATFGYPISQEFQEKNPDTGQTYTVQYFQRARFEWHPNASGSGGTVELGRLVASQLAAEGWLWPTDQRLPTYPEFR